MKITKATIYQLIAVLSSVWFALTSTFWVYYICLIFSYPFGILGYLLWRNRKRLQIDHKYAFVIPFILVIGLLLSFAMLIYLLVFD